MTVITTLLSGAGHTVWCSLEQKMFLTVTPDSTELFLSHLAWARCRLEVINRDHSKVYPRSVAITTGRRDVFNFTMEGNSQVSEAILIVTIGTDNLNDLIHSNTLNTTLS